MAGAILSGAIFGDNLAPVSERGDHLSHDADG